MHFIGSDTELPEKPAGGRAGGRVARSLRGAQGRALACGPVLGSCAVSHSSLSTARGPRPPSPSTEVASPSCVDGGPCPATATIMMPQPAQTHEAWPGLFVPWRPRGQLRLQLTRGHDLLLLRLLGPSLSGLCRPTPSQA